MHHCFPVTVPCVTSQIDCRNFVALDLKQAFGCSHLCSVILIHLVLLSLPLRIIFINILFQRVPNSPPPAIFLSLFLLKPTLLVVYIPWYLSIIEKKKFGFTNTPQTELIKKHKITQVVQTSSGGELESTISNVSICTFRWCHQ